MNESIEERIGTKHGMLTIVDYIADTNERKKYYCKCECGNFTNKDWNTLTRDNNASCGCYRKTKKFKRVEEMIGKTYNRLTVKSIVGEKQTAYDKKEVVVLTECDCGNETEQIANFVRNGKVLSCGKHNSELARERIIKLNNKE